MQRKVFVGGDTLRGVRHEIAAVTCRGRRDPCISQVRRAAVTRSSRPRRGLATTGLGVPAPIVETVETGENVVGSSRLPIVLPAGPAAVSIAQGGHRLAIPAPMTS